MTNYDPNRPRPSIDATASLPGDAAPDEASAPLRATSRDSAAADADSDADPVPAPASRLLPRQSEPLDRRLLAALLGAFALGWLLAATLAWRMWRRWRNR